MDDEKAKGELEAELLKASAQAESAGRKWDGWNRALWWLGISIAGAGVAAGYLGSIESIAHGAIKPWMVSAITSTGGAIEIIRRRTRWEALSNAYWAKYVEVTELLRRLRLGIDGRPPDDPIRSIVEGLEDAEDRFGTARDAAIRDRQRPAKE